MSTIKINVTESDIYDDRMGREEVEFPDDWREQLQGK